MVQTDADLLKGKVRILRELLAERAYGGEGVVQPFLPLIEEYERPEGAPARALSFAGGAGDPFETPLLLAPHAEEEREHAEGARQGGDRVVLGAGGVVGVGEVRIRLQHLTVEAGRPAHGSPRGEIGALHGAIPRGLDGFDGAKVVEVQQVPGVALPHPFTASSCLFELVLKELLFLVGHQRDAALLPKPVAPVR